MVTWSGEASSTPAWCARALSRRPIPSRFARRARYCAGRPKPLLRGRLHLWCALASPLWVCYQLRLCRSADALGAAALSLFGTVWLFAASGSFHRSEWPDVEHEDFAAKARRARARAASRVEHEPRPLVPLRAPLSARAQLDYVGIFLQVAFLGAPLWAMQMSSP